MKPVFPRINKAITFTLEYHTKDYIIEYMKDYTRMAKGLSSSSYKVEHWEEFLYDLHREMEEEILQTVYTSNQNTQVIMFEELREWIEVDWRLKDKPSSNFIWNAIDDYNIKANSELEEKLNIEVAKFQSTEEYKTLGENEEYEKKILSMPIWSSGTLINIPYTEQRVNRKYYCNEMSADFLDYYQMNKYYDFVVKIVGNFRKIVQKHLSLFDTGKYVPLQEISIQKEKIKLAPAEQKLLENPVESAAPAHSLVTINRLKVSVTVEQLAVLFRLLHDCNVITSSKKEIHEFVADHIQTVGMTNKRISAENFGKLFSSKNADIRNFWIGRLQKMVDKAGER